MMLTRGFGSIGTFCGGSGLWYTGAWIGLGLVFVAAVVVIAVLASRKKRPAGSEKIPKRLQYTLRLADPFQNRVEQYQINRRF